MINTLDIEITKKQQAFIGSTAFETLFGGAAGGGKSYGQLVDALLYASRQYAYDCGEDSGNESKNKKEAEQQESRNATLPEWMRGDSNDY